jgi:hypothetical protein
LFKLGVPQVSRLLNVSDYSLVFVDYDKASWGVYRIDSIESERVDCPSRIIARADSEIAPLGHSVNDAHLANQLEIIKYLQLK